MQGIHVAIIMDGNGRWASARGLPRVAGHRAGADTVRRVIEASPGLGISTLTLYAFSADNWRRPSREISALMRLLSRYLTTETDRCIREGVRLEAIGRRDRLPATVVAQIEQTERRTAAGRRLHLRLALDYSARTAIVDAARGLARSGEFNADEFARALGPDVDLLIRTSGEQRLSDFLLWESAYAEMLFTPRMWPDFSTEDLAAAVTEFHRRERRFGAVTPAAAAERRTA
jgi:undecaprenyl diphosphate synthase